VNAASPDRSGLANADLLLAQLFQYAILGFALAEAQGLFSIMIAFILLYGY
jgi:F-type H+-transporting ATPase subunit c